MTDPTRFPDDPATRIADERLMTPQDQSGSWRSGSLWRTPSDEFPEAGFDDADQFEESLDALEFEEPLDDMPDGDDAGGDGIARLGREGLGSAVAFARENPVGTALAAAGIALLFAPRTEREDLGAGLSRARGEVGRVARGGETRARSHMARQQARFERRRDALRQRLRQMRDRIEEDTEELSADARRRLVAARHRTLDARERALDHADRLRERAKYQARGGLETAREHPLLAGTLAVAAGAALAAALPRTRMEDSSLGGLGDRLMREAEEIYARERDLLSHAARGAWDEARKVAGEATHEMRETVPDGEDAARQAEERVGAGVSRIAEGARRGANRARDR